jgi:outer membrane protein
MTMKTSKIITAALLMLGTANVSAQDAILKLSLREACNQAVEKNVNVLNAGLEQRKTQYISDEAKSKLYPQIDGYSNFNYYYSIPKMVLPGEIFGQTGMIAVQIGTKYDWSSGFRASQILYDQSYFTSLKLAKRMENMSELSLKQKKEEIVCQVSQVYYLCLATDKQVSQLNITMHNTEKLLEIAKLQKENGIILKADYSRLMVTKTNLQTQIDNLNQLYQQQLGMLKYLIGLTQSLRVELSDSLSVPSMETSRTTPDFSNRTELQMLNKQMELTSLALTMNKQGYLPVISGFGQFYFQGQRDQFDFFKGGNDKFFKVGFVGLSISIPIF